MAIIKVFDISNQAIAWIAGKCDEFKNEKNVIFVTNKLLRSFLISQLLRYGIRDVLIDIPENILSNILKVSYIPSYKIVEIFRKRGLCRKKEIDDYLLYLWNLVNLYQTQKAIENDNDEQFLKEYNYHNYITIENYQEFKNKYKELGIVDRIDVIKLAYEKKIKLIADNLFVINYEDCSPILLKIIYNNLNLKNIYFVGDEYKIKPLYAINQDNLQHDVFIDISKGFLLPQNFYNSFLKVAEKIGFNKEIKTVQIKDAKITVISNLEKAINLWLFKNYEICKIVYDFPMQAEIIENYLFQKNIPFKGVTQTYKFPKNLYVISQVMESVLNLSNPITYKEVSILIKSIRGEITDKFGGKKKLLKHFCLPVFNPKTLAISSFFGYLKKAWVSKTFHLLLQEDLKKNWILWSGKLRKCWLEPKIYVGMAQVLKNLNSDISVYVQYSSNNPSIFYSLLTTTKKEIILTNF